MHLKTLIPLKTIHVDMKALTHLAHIREGFPTP